MYELINRNCRRIITNHCFNFPSGNAKINLIISYDNSKDSLQSTHVEIGLKFFKFLIKYEIGEEIKTKDYEAVFNEKFTNIRMTVS